MTKKWSDFDAAEKTAVTESAPAAKPGSNSGIYRMPKPHYLEMVEGPGAPQRIPLDHRQVLIIGRGDQADYKIDSEELSRRHVMITRDGEEFVAEDLDSRNGVYLNGVKVHSATLRDKDTLQLGGVVLVYHEGG